MNIKRAKDEIKDTIAAYLQKDEFGAYEIPAVRQRPVLLIGPPGVGKTQIMEQIARECRIGLVAYTITHHTRQSAIGLPYIVEKEYGGVKKSVTEYTMSEIVASVYDKMEETGLTEGILFIDEINCVSETLAPAMLQFLQGKSFGNHKIPEGWIIVAAGNPPEYNKSVRDFDVVTLDRIKMIHVEPDYSVWKEYAYGQSIHPAVLSYLNTRTEYFCRIETTVDGKLFATPRGWEDLSKFMEVCERLKKTVDRDVVSGYIQFPKIAKDFSNYLELYYKYREDYQVEEILAGTIRESLCRKLKNARFDEKLGVIGLLLSGLTKRFSEVYFQEKKTEVLMEKLKTVKISGTEKEKPDEAGEGQAGLTGSVMESQAGLTGSVMEGRITSLAQSLKAQREADMAAGFLNRRDERVIKSAEAWLEDCARTLRLEEPESFLEAWQRVSSLFANESDRYEKMADEAGSMLEHAFDFMEAAFGESQEMVTFVTELNMGQDCIQFLKEYECPRYYQYNESLLFKNREDAIKNRIDALGK